MESDTLVESSFSAIINAPVETIDIPGWCFSLPEAEYQACSPAHCSAGVTTAPDGRRMSINVEVLGGSPMVQHYVEEISEPHHLRLVLTSMSLANRQNKSGRDLGLEREEDRRRHLRVYQSGAQLLHAGAIGFSS